MRTQIAKMQKQGDEEPFANYSAKNDAKYKRHQDLANRDHVCILEWAEDVCIMHAWHRDL